MKRTFLLCCLFCSLFLQGYSQVTVENKRFSYRVGSNGKNISFADKTTGKEYLYTDSASYCSYIILEGKRYNVNRVSQQGNQVHLYFGESGVSASLLLDKSDEYLNIKLKEVAGKPESLVFLNIPLNLEAMPDEPFAACVLSMNIHTHVQQLPPLQNHLWASCYEKFGIVGSEVNLIGVPQEEILPVIRKIMKEAKELPFSDQGGAWASLGKEGYGSYLMQFGHMTEKTVDEWIALCRQLGFNQIDNHGGGDFFTFGELELNREKWPDGWQSFKRINDKLHKAGISSILHTYSFFIDKKCKYVTPVPSKDLGYFRTFTLAKPIEAGDTVIMVNESTEGMSAVVGYVEKNSVSLRLGNEIIEFQGVSTTKPYGFTGCKRGALGTKATAHQVADTLYHLREQYGRFLPNPDSKLFTEIAKKTADIVNECGFDGIYFDAIDGVRGGLTNNENAWYYGNKFVWEVARNLKKPVGMEMSDMFHQWWHYRSRWQAWDSPRRGYKLFFDLHADAVKGGKVGDFNPDFATEMKRRSLSGKGKLHLPLHFGWFGFETGIPAEMEPTFSDDIEYLCCKMLGNNAGLSILCWDHVRKNMKANETIKRHAEIIRQYETLRHQKYFDDAVLTKLRELGKEFTLVKEGRKWNLKPVTYSKQLIPELEKGSAKWSVTNDFGTQPLKVRIELLMSAKPYDDPDNIVLTDFSDVKAFTDRASAEGVASAIVSDNGNSRFQGTGAELSAFNLGVVPKWASWTKAACPFKSELNLSDHRALGLWIKGDGKGEVLNVRLQSPRHISFGARGDHLIPIDFTGWKYFELVENDGAEAYSYFWDSTGRKHFYPYSYFREQLNFGHINSLQFNYNSLPENEKVKCQVSPVKALPFVSNKIGNPTLTIGGQSVQFSTKMESGMYLELDREGKCFLYSSEGKLLEKVKLKGVIPVLKAGENEVIFSCDETKGVRCRARVTIATHGELLISNNKK